MSVTAFNPDDAPLKIVGFKLPAMFGDPPKVVVQNSSPKHVKNFYVMAVVGKADRNGTEFPTRGEAAAGSAPDFPRPDERAIPPKGDVEAGEPVLRSSIVAHWFRDMRTACLRIVTVVTWVEFADGSIWSLGPPWKSWKDSLPQGASSCLEPQEMEGTLRRLEGSGPKESQGLPTQLDSSRKESYSFSCSLREIRGRLVALCPF
ncbi:MAG: hypothetical protein L0Y58_25290 [Verrucomicrobia subdivision 3 bacterium]|nr:hypothetical protein [Limisphaerales bacterium]